MAESVKSIVLVPLGGLCNRLRAVLSAIALAKDCGAPLQVAWLRDEGLAARFEDLFEAMPAVVEGVAFTLNETTAWARYGVARRRNLWLPGVWQRMHFDTRLTESALMDLKKEAATETAVASEIRSRMHGDVLIQTGLGFYPADDRSFTRLFVPSEEVKKLLVPRLQMLTSDTVGIHIRRTDNEMAKMYSPMEAFVKVMEKETARRPGTNFYVATDDELVEEELAGRFQNCLIKPVTRGKGVRKGRTRGGFSPARSTVEGMQEAVAELFTLIACPRFYGSYWSSFSDTVVACHEKEETAKIVGGPSPDSEGLATRLMGTMRLGREEKGERKGREEMAELEIKQDAEADAVLFDTGEMVVVDAVDVIDA
ncbi:MAG: hypothetical protein K6A32_06740 [Bacteroidales bacterium]|nr:hypothetical protein [Bacteroidales bacterium]